ncbi:hypothetical protein [Vibrio vulnificus]|uniref:hypothetical protein n=1 Tax=Vibrio vulnificus TaxID=672 RepID=UPI00050311FE|nr:hypothetical protein [Vibrio vulnificus]ELJ8598088.1 hypothetical protein [Vibrio cholerae]KFK52804.1 hypothetical protein JS86_23230 [Vibrio vulnificus]
MSGGLIGKKTDKSLVREAMSSPSEIRGQLEAEQKKKTKEIQRKHREKYLDDWKSEKSNVDQMNTEQLSQYVLSTDDRASDPRVGLHSMKINAHEHAIIRLAMDITGARSSRELFVRHCKEVIKNSK